MTADALTDREKEVLVEAATLAPSITTLSRGCSASMVSM
jgi:hypothetical protein